MKALKVLSAQTCSLPTVTFTAHPTNLFISTDPTEEVKAYFGYFDKLKSVWGKPTIDFGSNAKSNPKLIYQRLKIKHWFGCDYDRGEYNEKHFLLGFALSLKQNFSQIDKRMKFDGDNLSKEDATKIDKLLVESEQIKPNEVCDFYISKQKEVESIIQRTLEKTEKLPPNSDAKRYFENFGLVDEGQVRFAGSYLKPNAKEVPFMLSLLKTIQHLNHHIRDIIIADFDGIAQLNQLKKLMLQTGFSEQECHSFDVIPLFEASETTRNFMQTFENPANFPFQLKYLMRACSDSTKRDGFAVSLYENYTLGQFALQKSLEMYIGTGTDVSRGAAGFPHIFKELIRLSNVNWWLFQGGQNTLQTTDEARKVWKYISYLSNFQQGVFVLKPEEEKMFKQYSHDCQKIYRKLILSDNFVSLLCGKDKKPTNLGLMIDNFAAGSRYASKIKDGKSHIESVENLRAIDFQTIFRNFIGISSLFLEIGGFILEGKQTQLEKHFNEMLAMRKNKAICDIYLSYLEVALKDSAKTGVEKIQPELKNNLVYQALAKGKAFVEGKLQPAEHVLNNFSNYELSFDEGRLFENNREFGKKRFYQCKLEESTISFYSKN